MSTRTAVGRTRRLLTPPLTGDGLLLVGLLEGLVGWPLSWLVVTRPSAAVIGPIRTLVALWGLLTVAIVVVGGYYALPAVRSHGAWVVWGVLNGLALGVNVLAILGAFPPELLVYAYWHPWLAAFGAGYLITALLDPEDPRTARGERAGYALAGLVSLLGLLYAFRTPILPRQGVIALGLLHVVPIGFDVGYESIVERW